MFVKPYYFFIGFAVIVLIIMIGLAVFFQIRTSVETRAVMPTAEPLLSSSPEPVTVPALYAQPAGGFGEEVIPAESGD